MKLLWPGGVVAVLALLCLILGGMLLRRSAECERESSRYADLHERVDTLEALSDVGMLQADSLRARITTLVDFPIQELDICLLRERGLKDPVQDVIADLLRHPEIIPYPGVLGGRMDFYDRDRIRVLNDSWVYAGFDDGHIVGDAIFGYRVGPGGKISWRVIASRLP
jgi:hypothetical protein